MRGKMSNPVFRKSITNKLQINICRDNSDCKMLQLRILLRYPMHRFGLETEICRLLMISVQFCERSHCIIFLNQFFILLRTQTQKIFSDKPIIDRGLLITQPTQTSFFPPFETTLSFLQSEHRLHPRKSNNLGFKRFNIIRTTSPNSFSLYS